MTTTTDTNRTRADRLQQVADFLGEHPEIEADLSDRSASVIPTLSFHPRDTDAVKALLAALHESGDHWDTTYLAQGWVTLDSGALGYAAVTLHLPLVEQPMRVVEPAVAEFFA